MKQILNTILGLCDPMDAKFDKIRDICRNELDSSSSSNGEKKYVKFVVLYNKPGNPPNAVPWTGIDQTMKFVRDRLEDGYVVQVKPFTMDGWSSND